MNKVVIIVFLITSVSFFLDLLREILIYRDIKSCFYCGHCNTFNEEISRIDKCKKCHRNISIRENTWEHLVLHRVNWIPANSKSEVFKWKEYRKLSIIEIVIDTVAIIILSFAIVSELL